MTYEETAREDIRRASDPRKTSRSDAELAQMIVRVAGAARVDAIISVTETGTFARRLHGLSDRFRIIGATTNRETYDVLTQAGLEMMLLPLHAADKYSQVRHVISVALTLAKVSIGDLVICAPVVASEAREQFRSEVDHWAHLTVHGVLHLLGYDHEKAEEAGIMESLETEILAKLGISDPYLDLG